jgi:hypothetical protein
MTCVISQLALCLLEPLRFALARLDQRPLCLAHGVIGRWFGTRRPADSSGLSAREFRFSTSGVRVGHAVEATRGLVPETG